MKAPDATAQPELCFERYDPPSTGDRHQRYVVTFARGGEIECHSEREARRLTAAHLERARRNQVEEAVISAIWFATEFRLGEIS